MLNMDSTSREWGLGVQTAIPPSPPSPGPCAICLPEEGRVKHGRHPHSLPVLPSVCAAKEGSLAGSVPSSWSQRISPSPLCLFPCPSARSPQGYSRVPQLGKTGPGSRLGSALAAVRISLLIYTAVSSDRLILQLCLEPAAGPGLWMNQLSLGLGFYFIIFLQLPSQAAKEREREGERKSWHISFPPRVLPASQLGFGTPGGWREGIVFQGLTAVRNKDMRLLLQE